MNTRVVPVTVISSSPSEPRTTSTRWPRRANAPAIVSIWSSKAQPMRLAAGCAGLVSGPRRLNRVGTANCERTGPA